ncbi:aminoglycoside adenylyltransferase domain-containing protein [Paenibacillus sp. 1011MAR3C5]|uniref:aminoglycoside adenylyltransferase domain-containing protein n=1 Tax=Paenibacillus sp. 1011MAR3C5 TaxID=1675787 RepID=UPI00160252F4|nr:aminoglycoside adenylyltransferase domain-containing protein [Paenibacillus sp. 1011MAR3C5]
MKGLHWEDSPPDIRRQALLINNYMNDFLGDTLIGLYVHGSLCLGAYHPGRSDLDMLAVINRPLTPDERHQLIIAFLMFHRTPAPVEVSIMLHEDLKLWKHPAPYQLHFSDYWRKRYADMAYWDNRSFWHEQGERTDSDLACHITLTRQLGIALYGPPLAAISSAVPEPHFWDSLRSDAESLMTPSASEDKELRIVDAAEAMGVLTLARIWSYRETGLIYSKLEAAEWAMARLPEKQRPIISGAIDIYLESARSYSCPNQHWNELRALLLASCPLSYVV